MVKEMIDGTYRQTNLPNESPEYLAKREEVRLAEIELLKQRERVAELRRALPEGATVTDYEFLEGPASLDEGDEPVTKVRLSELFTAPDRSLVIYHFMFGKKQANPCPMCTAWIDAFNGIAHHVAQNVDLAIVKRFQYRDRAKIEVRGDGYNLFNHAQFTGMPISTLGSGMGFGMTPSFLLVSNPQFNNIRGFLSGNPRTVQLALRLLF